MTFGAHRIAKTDQIFMSNARILVLVALATELVESNALLIELSKDAVSSVVRPPVL